MPSRQYVLVFLTTTLLVTLPSQSGFAFSITPPSPANNTNSRSYFVDVEGAGSVVGQTSLTAFNNI